MNKKNKSNFLIYRIKQKEKSLEYWKKGYLKVLSELKNAHQSLQEIIQNNQINTKLAGLNNQQKEVVKVVQPNFKEESEKDLQDSSVSPQSKELEEKIRQSELSLKNKLTPNINPLSVRSVKKETSKPPNSPLIKLTGKLLSVPSETVDGDDNTVYYARFSKENSSETYQIYLSKNPVLSDKQKHRLQYWPSLLSGFSKLLNGTKITIEGYPKNSSNCLNILGYFEE